jgi:hypothetical protein
MAHSKMYAGPETRQSNTGEQVMDQETSHELLSALSPTLLISAHTHAPCIRKHALAPNTPSLDTDSDNSDEVKKDSVLLGQSTEVTLPTVAWRMRPDPGEVRSRFWGSEYWIV